MRHESQTTALRSSALMLAMQCVLAVALSSGVVSCAAPASDDQPIYDSRAITLVWLSPRIENQSNGDVWVCFQTPPIFADGGELQDTRSASALLAPGVGLVMPSGYLQPYTTELPRCLVRDMKPPFRELEIPINAEHEQIFIESTSDGISARTIARAPELRDPSPWKPPPTVP